MVGADRPAAEAAKYPQRDPVDSGRFPRHRSHHCLQLIPTADSRSARPDNSRRRRHIQCRIAATPLDPADRCCSELRQRRNKRHERIPACSARLPVSPIMTRRTLKHRETKGFGRSVPVRHCGHRPSGMTIPPARSQPTPMPIGRPTMQHDHLRRRWPPCNGPPDHGAPDAPTIYNRSGLGYACGRSGTKLGIRNPTVESRRRAMADANMMTAAGRP